MDLMDVYYRALVDYRKSTMENRDASTQRQAMAKASTENDKIELIRSICTIEEDWVNEIENGLVYVEKAIAEQRQFIQSNGEVLPIEKVKHVSKESVEHLAKHTNLVDKLPEEGERLIPSQLYTVERYSDFAVYENKFLYLLLTYLRDFIQIRYEKILELTNTYRGNMRMKKTLHRHDQTIEYEVTLKEERKNDEYLSTHNKAKDIIDRIKTCLNGVMALLATPLMEEVAKVPPIKPPITRTNVLKMNHNFKNALALYSFVTDYDKDGYTIKNESKVVAPFGEETADELAETVLLSSFLTYEHSLDIKKLLKENYEKEEKARKELENLKHIEQIKAVRRHVKENGGDVEEYMLLLEKRNKSLENDAASLLQANKTIDKLEQEQADLEEQVESLEEELDSSQQEIASLTYNHSKEVAELRSAAQQQATKLETAYRQNLARAVQQYKQQQEAELAERDEEIEALMEEREEQDQEHAAKIAQMSMQYGMQLQKVKDLENKIAQMNEEKQFMTARLNALRNEKGYTAEIGDYTSQEAFRELEEEYKLFQEFFEKEWKDTKKAIRKNVLRKPAKELKEEIAQDKEREKAEKAAKKPEKVKKEKPVKEKKSKKADDTAEDTSMQDINIEDMQGTDINIDDIDINNL